MNTRPIIAAKKIESLPIGAAWGAGVQHLQTRWQSETLSRCTVLQTQFGCGELFLALWQAWRQLPEPRGRLDVIALCSHPPQRQALPAAQAYDAPVALVQALHAQWPPLTPNVHSLVFEAGRVRLLLALGEPWHVLPELVAPIDAFFLGDEAGAPDIPWHASVYKGLARLAVPGATVALRSSNASHHPGLRSAGFELHPRDNAWQAHFAPHPTQRTVPMGRHAPGKRSGEKHAVIVGGGLAGCASAWALARLGWRCTVVDEQATVAMGASGNRAGLFHGVVHGSDGSHARWGRAAALRCTQALQEAIEQYAQQQHGIADAKVLGEMRGLLRLQDSDGDATQMAAVLQAAGLPADYVQAFGAAQASLASGLGEQALQQAAWFYPRGGWLRPALLCQHWLQTSQAVFLGSRRVARLQPDGDEWLLLDAQGQCVAHAPQVVLANAQQASTLLATTGHAQSWPLLSLRGQVSEVPLASSPFPLRLPLAGSGYCLPVVNGKLLFGATNDADDDDPHLRPADHDSNLNQLVKLLGAAMPNLLRTSSEASWTGRVGWRCTAVDRLPLVGPVLKSDASTMLTAPLRQLPRVTGLHVCTALGSRGITWAALAGEVVASYVSGAAMPVESSLLDAIDPVRFAARETRKAS
ncbi:MAG: FAD-dependent 5-carboxymethylaminomethyl-2-thiouridine(34) oxidoreductase MnmC [Burkholderiales bacterium]